MLNVLKDILKDIFINEKNTKKAFVIIHHNTYGYLVLFKEKNKGQLVGGRVDKSDKNSFDSLIREIFEETGLIIDKNRFYYLGIIDSKCFYYLEISNKDSLQIGISPESDHEFKLKLSNEHHFYKFISNKKGLKKSVSNHSGGTCLKAIKKFL
jgi:8-oxo-dGTP pyrophosphatase MutT (NUDIX family)